MKKNIIIILLFVLGFWGVFKLFQMPTIYNKTLGLISKNYQFKEENGERLRVKQPYKKLSNKNLIQWDAFHYHEIKDQGYQRGGDEQNDYIYAFFPLFPLMWKITGLSPIGIIFVNFLLYVLGLLL